MITSSRFDSLVRTGRLSESIDVDTFKAAFRMHPAGVSVITADAGNGPAAMTISSLTSVSTEPPLVTFSLSALSWSTPAFLESDTVVVHLLGSEHLRLAQLGATGGVDRFADKLAWTRLPTGEPVFRETYAWLRGKIVHRLEAGNAVICVAHIVQASVPDADAVAAETSTPLVYHSRTWHQLGTHSAI
jgi:flavin reductase (DIM6/NTAB) family NADH-FMN oxidoreductase RutF